MVEIAHIKAKLQRARSDDHAVRSLGKRSFGRTAFRKGKRRMRQEYVNAPLRERVPKPLDTAAAIHEDKSPSARVHAIDEQRGVLEVADVVEHESSLTPSAARVDHSGGTHRAATEPRDDVVSVAYRRGQSDSLDVMIRQ